MDFYRQLALEALQEMGEKGELLFRVGRSEVWRHTAEADSVREAGNYLTVLPTEGTVAEQEDCLRKATIRALGWLLNADKIASNRALVVGLGNATTMCDALGAKTLERMRPTQKMLLFCPNTQSQTGIPSGDSTRWLAKETRADLVVVVDTLACSSPHYLCRSVQVSDAGIRPGAGLGQARKALNRQTVGVPVVYLGIPMLSFVDPFADRQCVIPQNIEEVLSSCAALLSECIAAALAAL